MQDIRQMAQILTEKYGEEKAIAYCKSKMDKYEKLLEKVPENFDDLNERDSHKIMRNFFISVSLAIQTPSK